MSAVLELKGLRKQFGNLTVLDGIDLSVAKGDVIALIGASGSGKSTLLRCVNGLEIPTNGEVIFGGERVGAENLNQVRTRIGMVFQRFNLFPHLTALENVTLAPIRVLGKSKEEAEAKGMELLARVKLDAKAHSHPAQLSGGQQQRVAIARALALEPELMLFDEPTSALDPELVGEVLEVMRQLAKGGMTMLVATHEMAFARDAASEVSFLDGGKILESGPPAQVLSHPKEARTREFLARVLG